MDEAQEEKKEIKGSPSQLADYKLCKRKWGHNKLDGVKTPPHPSAELGTRVHDVLEKWLRFGTEIDTSTREGAIAAAGIQYLPAPSKELEIEQWIELTTEVMPYVGKVDLAFKRPSGRVMINDHKTSGDLNWAKTEEELRTDPQALIYAAEAMDRHKVDEVDLQWLYLRTKGSPKAKPVRLTILRHEVESGIAEHVDPFGAEMLEHKRSGKKAMDLPPTTTACSAYGGCGYRSLCNITVADMRRQVHMAESALEKIKREKAERAAAAGGAPPNGASAAAAPVVAPVPPPKTAAKPAAINPPEAPTARGPAGVDLSPLVAALKDAAARLAPRDLRDELLLTLARSGNIDLVSYEIVDEILSKRGGK